MRYIINILFLGFFVINSVAQKHDNLWMIGFHQEASSNEPMTLDFEYDKLRIVNNHSLSNFYWYSTTMCDSLGELMFYSNGLHIYNREHKIMINGNTINPGTIWDIFSKERGSYGSRLGGKSIPFPNHPNEYLHFHLGLEPISLDFPQGYAPFYLSRIDMNLTDALGACIERNVVLGDLNERYTYFDLTQHANGRDWWLILLNALTKEYYRFLIDPNGVTKDTFKLKIDYGPQNGAWLGFSPDGKYLIVLESSEQFTIIDFDRCNGELSNERIIKLPSIPGGSFFNFSFSPNSQFLYIGNVNEIFQIDLFSARKEKSVFCVTESDRYIETFSTSYLWSQLGPDGRIYITTGNENKVLHVINRPNLPGLACDVQQHGIELPSRNFLGIPHFPNYRLGALEGSECDTLHGVVPKVEIIDSTNGDFKFAGKWYKYAYKP